MGLEWYLSFSSYHFAKMQQQRKQKQKQKQVQCL